MPICVTEIFVQLDDNQQETELGSLLPNTCPLPSNAF